MGEIPYWMKPAIFFLVDAPQRCGYEHLTPKDVKKKKKKANTQEKKRKSSRW